MPTSINNAQIFLVAIVFDLFMFILILRFIMQIVGVNFYNPIVQLITKVTNPIIHPLQRVIPRYKNSDLATLLLVMALQMLKITLLAWIQVSALPNIFGVLIWSIGGLLDQVINIFFYAVLIVIILSWINPQGHNPIREVLHTITEPLMRPARRLIPNIGGLDISPIPVMIGLKLLAILFVTPLLQIGAAMALKL